MNAPGYPTAPDESGLTAPNPIHGAPLISLAIHRQAIPIDPTSADEGRLRSVEVNSFAAHYHLNPVLSPLPAQRHSFLCQ